MFIYADNAATTKIDDDVLETMLPYLKENYGNPSSIHSKGRQALKAMDDAREIVAKSINCDAKELFFTGGGSESDNWAIKGVANHYKKNGKHIISTKIEHHAVLHSLKALEKEGFEVTYLDVDNEGFISLEELEKAIRPDTILITIMFANNEIGTVEPITEIGKIARKHGIIFHTDAVQAVGHIPVDVKAMNIDLLSMSAHKFNAAKGVGALYIKRGIVIPGFIDGGGQERGKRAGTENTAAIVGMSYALQKAVKNMDNNIAYVLKLKDKLMKGLSQLPHCKQNTPSHDSLPGVVNFSIKYIEGEALLLMLDMNGICASSGSACTSGSLDPSHVLLAIGLSHDVAHGSLRFSLDHNNTEEEIDFILKTLPGIVTRLRSMSPLWEKLEKEENK
ncbi:MAG: iscS1 [Clostridia bacterium]|nr:iscS1 [Clostridia bacterium]